jgi:hypothetical protein
MGLVVRVAVGVSVRPISRGRAGPAAWSVQASACGAVGREAGRERKMLPEQAMRKAMVREGRLWAAVAAPQGGKR